MEEGIAYGLEDFQREKAKRRFFYVRSGVLELIGKFIELFGAVLWVAICEGTGGVAVKCMGGGWEAWRRWVGGGRRL